jgi:hypothetical protein
MQLKLAEVSPGTIGIALHVISDSLAASPPGGTAILTMAAQLWITWQQRPWQIFGCNATKVRTLMILCPACR